MKHAKFQGTFLSWEQLFTEAAAFATTLGPSQVHGISHSASDGRGIVNVWYWEPTDAAPAPAFELEVRFEFKRATLISWDELFQWASDKAGEFTREQVISVSHSDSKGSGIVVLWYWSAPGD